MQDLIFPKIRGVALTPMSHPTHTPMGRKIGLQFLAAGPEHIGSGLIYAAKLVGNRHTGVVHGGVVTALIDETAGAAVVQRTKSAYSVATLDLRVDYMRPARPERPLFCLAHCHLATRRIAFFRAEAFHTPSRPIAVGTGTFMLGANQTSPGMIWGMEEVSRS
ncbi:MAG: PaaI family thioesterase [Gammaproteobacteria bacterium AqS3]|nr:PaaI family thioesterase [Gammaproteobacteria bacterium AqS3]